MVRDQYQQQSNLMPVALLVERQLAGGPADAAAVVDHDVRHRAGRDRRADPDSAQARSRQGPSGRAGEADRGGPASGGSEPEDPQGAGGARGGGRRPAWPRCSAERQTQQAAAADDVRDDKARYAQLNTERASVEQRIAVRIAKAKAEAALAKAKAERREPGGQGGSRAKRAARTSGGGSAARRAAGEDGPRGRAAGQGGPRSPGREEAYSGGQEAGGGFVTLQQRPAVRATGFSFPVSGPITSSYGHAAATRPGLLEAARRHRLRRRAAAR